MLRQEGAEQPVRTKSAKGNRYELFAVVYEPNDAYIVTLDEVKRILIEEGHLTHLLSAVMSALTLMLPG